MKIAVFAHIRHAIREPYAGGMEAHCAGLCAGLRAAGHDVTLFAAGGSEDENLQPICAAPYDDVLPWEQFRGTEELASYQRTAFIKAWRMVRQSDFDIVHNNSLFPEIIDWAARDGVPCLTSQHVPPFGTMKDAVEGSAAFDNCVFSVTSEHQRTLWDESACPNLRVVPNGVDTQVWTPAARRQNYCIWVGRITPNKGLAEAVEAAHRAGIELRIYGPMEDPGYFDAKVRRWLSEKVRYFGHIERDELRAELAPALASIVTPMWDEPFGLVAAEALSCGVPVIAFDRGALREVVGHCGVLVEAGDIGALCEAMTRASDISRASCRQRAIERLSQEAMIAGYERCYSAAIDGASRLADRSASRSSSHSSTSLLLA